MDSRGLSGGIGLFWSVDIRVELKNYSSGHIDCVVQKVNGRSDKWRFTVFYGEPKKEEDTRVGVSSEPCSQYNILHGFVLATLMKLCMCQIISCEPLGLNGKCGRLEKLRKNVCGRILDGQEQNTHGIMGSQEMQM